MFHICICSGFIQFICLFVYIYLFILIMWPLFPHFFHKITAFLHILHTKTAFLKNKLPIFFGKSMCIQKILARNQKVRILKTKRAGLVNLQGDTWKVSCQKWRPSLYCQKHSFCLTKLFKKKKYFFKNIIFSKFSFFKKIYFLIFLKTFLLAKFQLNKWKKSQNLKFFNFVFTKQAKNQ